jgi:large conductance mechanosensitive channel
MSPAQPGSAFARTIAHVGRIQGIRAYALVNDIIMPILGIAGKADFTNYYMPLSGAVTATNLADARKQGGVLAYGDFITVVINFLIVAIALFAAIKAINIMTRRAAKEPPVPAPPTKEVVLLTEIRDQLAKRGA